MASASRSPSLSLNQLSQTSFLSQSSSGNNSARSTLVFASSSPSPYRDTETAMHYEMMQHSALFQLQRRYDSNNVMGIEEVNPHDVIKSFILGPGSADNGRGIVFRSQALNNKAAIIRSGDAVIFPIVRNEMLQNVQMINHPRYNVEGVYGIVKSGNKIKILMGVFDNRGRHNAADDDYFTWVDGYCDEEEGHWSEEILNLIFQFIISNHLFYM